MPSNKEKLRPCDCIDSIDAMRLEEQGIGWNNDRISIRPNSVILELGHTTVTIPMSRFKMMAEWYLTEQETKSISEVRY